MKFKANQRLLNGMLLNDIKTINRTLKNHGEAHLAQEDGNQISQHIKDHRENSRKIETWMVDWMRRVEKLEKIPSPSLNIAVTANHSKRIADLEESTAGLWEKGTEQDEGIASLLKMLTDIEILKMQMNGLIDGKELSDSRIHHDFKEIEDLKVQVAGIKQDNTRAYAVHHKEAFDAVYAKMKEQRGDYHDHIRQLVEENTAAHIQQSDTIMHVQKQIAALETRLSRAQDTLAEMQMDVMKHESPANKTKKRGEIMKVVQKR